jgi:hypothetical protein
MRTSTKNTQNPTTGVPDRANPLVDALINPSHVHACGYQGKLDQLAG